MAHETFVSIVVAIVDELTVDDAAFTLAKIDRELNEAGIDVEYLVASHDDPSIVQRIVGNMRADAAVYSVRLGDRSSWDTLAFASLCQSNGDLAIVIDLAEPVEPKVLLEMIGVLCGQADVVILQRKRIQWQQLLHVRRTLFYLLLQRRVAPAPGIRTLRYLGITRKALNWSLRRTSSASFLPELYIASPLPTIVLNVSTKSHGHDRGDRGDTATTAWNVLVRHTNIPFLIARLGTSFLIIVLLVVVANAVKGAFTGSNILGYQDSIPPGWTTLVVVICLGFVITNFLIVLVIRLLTTLLTKAMSDQPFVVVSSQRVERRHLLDSIEIESD